MSKIDDIFRRVRKSAWLDTRYILVGAYMCMRREDLCILVITRARARVNDKMGACMRANDYRRSFTINAHFNCDGYVEIITRRSSVGHVRARAHVCVCVCALRSRILTNETNKFALARMRTCRWKFPDSRESSRVRSRENIGFFLRMSSSAYW